MQKIDEEIIIMNGKEWIKRYNSFFYLKEDESVYIWYRSPFWIGQDDSQLLCQYYFKENAARQSLNFKYNKNCCEIVQEDLPLFISLETMDDIPHEPNNEDNCRGVYDGYVTYIEYQKVINNFCYRIYENISEQQYRMIHLGYVNSLTIADKVIIGIIDTLHS